MLKGRALLHKELVSYKKINTRMFFLFIMSAINIGLYFFINYKYPLIFIQSTETFPIFRMFIDVGVYIVLFIMALSIVGRIYAQHQIKRTNILLKLNPLDLLSKQNILSINRSDRSELIPKYSNQILKIKKSIFSLIVILTFTLVFYYFNRPFTISILSWFFFLILILTVTLILVLSINLILWKVQLSKIIKATESN